MSFFSSVFNSLFGSNDENEPENEANLELSEVNGDVVTIETNDKSQEIGKDKNSENETLSNKSKTDAELEYRRKAYSRTKSYGNILKETRFQLDDSSSNQERQRIDEMLAEITSQETGYSSEDHDDSFEHVSVEGGDNQARTIRGTSQDRSINRTYNNGARVLTSDEIHIEYDRSIKGNQASTVRHLGDTTVNGNGLNQSERLKKGLDTNPKISTISNFKFDLQKLRAGATNKAFEPDDDAIVSKAETDDNKMRKVTSLMGKRLQAQTRWKKIAENRDVAAGLPEGARVLMTNPLIAARLTQSYARAKKRVQETEATKFETFKNVHLKRLKAKLRYFIDHHADSSYQFKKKKYYDESSSDDELFSGPEDVYSAKRKKKWWMKRPKTGSDRLKQYRFYGNVKVKVTNTNTNVSVSRNDKISTYIYTRNEH